MTTKEGIKKYNEQMGVKIRRFLEENEFPQWLVEELPLVFSRSSR